MQQITVNKADLLETLRRNRDEHRSMFLKAQEVYREKMIAELDRALAEARDGEKIRRGFALPEPVDYTAEFDTTIEMLEWETGDEISLDHRDFARFVQNKWEWAQNFAASTQAYLTE